MKIRKITTCGLFIALATVASIIKLYSFPFGGSVTLFSMLVITLPAWIYGPSTGILCGFVYGIIQFSLGPTMVSIPQVILDYALAFSIMGIGGFVNKGKHSLIKSYSLAVLGRWVIATLAGLAWIAAGSTAWDGWSPLPYSMAYNAAYIFAEALITLIIIWLPPMKKALEHIKSQAISS